jgi:CheY-like chemotaxis protein
MGEGQTNILMVEDTLTQAMMLQHMLESNSFTVKHAKDGEEALKLLAENPFPDLILTDVNMPGIDGYQLCEKLKSEDKWRGIPIILLASLLEPSDIIKIMQSGADNFILKHYEENYFISRLRGIVDSIPFAKEDAAEGTRKVTLAGEDFEVSLQPSKMLDMLVSAFETAVYQNWKAKESDDEE